MQRGTVAHIEATPGICGGRPRIAGHRIRIQDIAVWHESWGMTPDEIVSEHPGITLADVHAALAYYHDHREDIESDMREDEATVARARKSNPSKLVKKLISPDGGNDPLSP